jgi:hypothetical protein
MNGLEIFLLIWALAATILWLWDEWALRQTGKLTRQIRSEMTNMRVMMATHRDKK